MKDEHVKDSAQDVAEDVKQDVAGEVLGAAEDGFVKVLIVARVIFQRRNYAQHTHSTLMPALGRHVNDKHVKDAAQDAA